MELSISQAIHLLLMSHRAVSVPHLGVFRAEYKPASIDHVGGIIRPPSRFVTFEAGEEPANTLLADFLTRRHPDAGLEQVMNAIATFADEIRNQPESHPVLEIPELGRFYKNFENKIQFVSDFSEPGSTHHGLPELHYHPIDRRTVAEAPEQPIAPPTAKAVQQRKPVKFLPWVVAFVALVVASFIYYSLNYQKSAQQSETFRMNEPPTTEVVDESKPTETPDKVPDPVTTNDVANAGDAVVRESEDTDAASLPPGVQQCVIIIGAYSTKEGANAAVKKLVEYGFAVYSDKRRGVTRVGASVLYENDAQVDEALTFLQREFDPDAFILKK